MRGGLSLDQREMQENVELYVRQQLAAGTEIQSVIEVARQLNLPVTMVDRAMRNLSKQGIAGLPYTNATEY